MSMFSLYGDNGTVLIDNTEIIGIVRSALGKIDTRLVEHGERVGYIAALIREKIPDKSEIDLSKLLVLCLLHDIGAYKTNEIDDMIKFETDTVFDHSLYGYLFLKNTSHLSGYAEALLYHHTDYSSPSMKTCRVAAYAQLIHLADRADILINHNTSGISALASAAGTKFNPVYTQVLLREEEDSGLLRSIRNGSYKAAYNRLVDSIEISNSDVMDYLMLLVYAIDFRSPYTVTHTADTTLIAIETGKLAGLGEHDLQLLYAGSFLHDIGKIAVPMTVLEKPGRLTPEEYEIVKRHIPEGEQILRGVVSDEIADIALRHHEKLNGSGYSRGLTGDRLTLPQRITAVADILSALSQRRTYKEPYPKDRVTAILLDMKNKGELCPVTVDTVCENYDLILGNTEKSHDPVKAMYNNLVREYGELCEARLPRKATV